MTISTTEVITIVVTGKVAEFAEPGLVVTNEACATWASLPDGLNDADRRTDGDGLLGEGGLNDYEVCDPAIFETGGDYAISKQLINSDAPSTTDPDLTIGESVTYTLRVTMTEDAWLLVRISDTLPSGMRLVSQEVITQANPRLGLANDFAGILNNGFFTSTNSRLEWGFSSVLVAGNNIDDDNTFLILFEAVVENVIGNQQPGVRPNAAQLAVSRGVVKRSNTVDVNIVEPTLAIDKSVMTAAPNPDAGAAVTYTIVLRHTLPSIEAQDVVISDTIPASLDNVILSSITSSSGQVIVGSATGNLLRIPAGTGGMQIAPTETITIVVLAEISDVVTPGTLISNTACVTWASLPDGLNDADRRTDGDGLLGAGGLNDYEVCDTAVIATSGAYTITKALVGSSAAHTTDPSLTIGEVVTYSLRISMTEGTWPSTLVTDTLPAGLVYVDGSTVLDSTGFAGTVNAPTVSPPAPAPSGGGDLLFNLGTVVVEGDNSANDNAFTIRFRARVMDIAANVGLPGQQSTLTNGAAMNAVGLPPAVSNDVDIIVVEPRMVIVKEITPEIAPPQSVVTVTLTVSNTGLSTGFEAPVQDVVPVGLTYVAGTLLETQSNGATTAVLTDTGAPTLQAWYSIFPTGTASILTFQATIDANVPPRTVITNTAVVSGATTLPGVDPNERTEPPDDDDATVETITHDLVLSKTNGRADYEAGGLLTYTISITNVGQALAPGVTVTETVPNNTTFVAEGSTPTWMHMPLGITPCATGDPAGTVCRIGVGDIAPGASVSVTFVVRVDSPLPSPAPVIENAACADTDDSLGPEPTPADNCDSHDNNYELAQLGDRVWIDRNGNGIQDPGEFNYPTMVINLYRLGTPAPISTTISALNGSYFFTNLPPGIYQVEFVPPTLPSGARNPAITLQHEGSDPAIDSDPDPDTGFTQEIILLPGEINDTIDAGVYFLSAIGDRVWHDRNANGLQDFGEFGIPNVTMELLRDGVVISTTTTGPLGRYIFTQLTFGRYSVRIGDVPGYYLSPYKVGSNDFIDSDFHPDTRETPIQDFSEAPRLVLTLDAGLYQLASLGDFVWADINANGIQNTGEPGRNGALVTLTMPAEPELRDDDDHRSAWPLRVCRPGAGQLPCPLHATTAYLWLAGAARQRSNSAEQARSYDWLYKRFGT